MGARQRRMVRDLGLRALKVVAAASDRVRSPSLGGADGVVILIYHRVGARTGVQVDLPSSLFDRQMEMLAASGRAMGLDDAIDALGGGTQSVANPVVVTFDDGTADFVDEAVPILVHHQVPCTLYLATDFVERGRSFPDRGLPVSWAGLAEAVSTGLVTIGSHTHTHRLLDRVDPSTAAEELDRSTGLIEERLGLAARHFAYPKAVVGNASARHAVGQRFRSAAVGGTRANAWAHHDVYQLTRSAIQVADGMRWFTRKVDGGMALEDHVRQRINRRRYADATT